MKNFLRSPPKMKKVVDERDHVYWGEEHPKDYLLGHNFARPTSKGQLHGTNGFRAMWIPPEYTKRKPPFEVCNCGWRPDLGKHYAVK